MKISKNLTTAIIITGVIVLIVFRLISNKNKLASELSSMLEYTKVVPVEVIKASHASYSGTITETGRFSPTTVVPLISETQGRVIKVYVNTGDLVKPGQLLAQVEKEVLEKQVQLSKTNLENALRDMNRLKVLAESDAVTKQQYEASLLNYHNAQAGYSSAKKAMDNSSITSPIGGYISDKNIENGSTLSPGMLILSVCGMSNLQFETRLSENNISAIKKGQKVEVFADIDKSSIIEGVVKEIDIKSDETNKFKVIISVPNKGFSIKGGMSGKVTFNQTKKDNTIILPRKAITGSLINAVLYIVQGDSVVIKKVNAKRIDENKIEITDGLIGNELVVLSGQINLTNGTKIKVLNSK